MSEKAIIKGKRTKKQAILEQLQQPQPSSPESVVIDVNLKSLQNMQKLFTEQAAQAKAKIEQAQKLLDYLDQLEPNQLPDYLLYRLPLISEGLNLLVNQEEQRVSSMQQGIDETTSLLSEANNH